MRQSETMAFERDVDVLVILFAIDLLLFITKNTIRMAVLVYF